MINRGEGQRLMEIAFRRCAFANPGGGNLGVALVGRSHGPAYGLRKLRAKISREREEARIAHRIEHWQLPSLQPVIGIGIDLAHQVEYGQSRATRRPCWR